MGCLREIYRSNPRAVLQVLAEVRRRISDYSDPSVWIHRCDWDQVMGKADSLLEGLAARGNLAGYPLFGIPFAVKDNIDVAGLPTSAGCPAFAYTAKATAFCVARLEAAGAVLIGKTNMDQFATGLVGTRSPYGAVRNAFKEEYISGGSSSGSAVAVAAGLVSFALGTDTAGSGRIPAGFNNIVGLKPSRGLISARGVFPACRSLDCVSVFALTCNDTMEVLSQAQGPDGEDPFSRTAPPVTRSRPPEHFRFGVPDDGHLEFFGDDEYAVLFREARGRLESMGGMAVTIPFAPFAEAARLLYQGPWLAERQAAFGDFLDGHPQEVLPVIREVMSKAKGLSALDGFKAYYRLKELRSAVAALFGGMDFLLVPTAATHYTRAQVEADPILLNTRLGYYTNFANLLDLSAIAVPSGLRGNGLPFGITCIAPAFREPLLAALGSAFHSRTGLPLGATGATDATGAVGASGSVGAMVAASAPSAASAASASSFTGISDAGVRLAVAGLHLSGQPLNPQLTDLGARLALSCRTAPNYGLHALTRGPKHFPGLVRRPSGGAAIEVEVWEMSPSALGAFLENVREPLCIGTVELESGEKVKGFLCESYGAEDAPDITSFGGWRSYLFKQSSG
jgi:allophanate hydrolase